MLNNKKIGFIGSGNMGEALINGLIGTGASSPGNIITSDVRSDRLQQMQDKYNINSGYNNPKLSEVDKRRKRAIVILNNCFEHEKLLVPKSYSLSKFNLEFAQ